MIQDKFQVDKYIKTKYSQVLEVHQLPCTQVHLEWAFTRTLTFILLHAVTIETQPVHHAARTECSGCLTGMVDNTKKSICTGDVCHLEILTYILIRSKVVYKSVYINLSLNLVWLVQGD